MHKKSLLWPLVFVLIFFSVALFRHNHSLFNTFDTGLYLQLAVNYIINGSLASSVTGANNFLSIHFQPSFLLISPLLAIFPNPIMSAFIAIGSILIGVMIFHRETKTSNVWLAVITCIFVLHPSISGRIWYNFAPDIMAIPALIWLAFRLDNREPKPWIIWVLVLAWSGGCKEILWVVGAWVCLIRAWYVREERYMQLLLSVAQIAIFCFLYFFWMPGHSNGVNYFYQSFYFPNGFENYLDAFFILLSNLFSLRSIKTISLLIFATGFIPFIKFRISSLGAIPGMAVILLSHSGQIHHIGNHYLIPVLPFLLVAGIHNADLATKFFARVRPTKWWLIIPAMLLTIFYNGIVDSLALGIMNSRTVHFREDARHFAQNYVSVDYPLLIDGGLQPHIPEVQTSIVLLNFTGNPHFLTAEEMNESFYVLTSTRLKNIENCSQVKIGSNLDVNLKYFQKLCLRVKSDAKELVHYDESGITGYFVQKRRL